MLQALADTTAVAMENVQVYTELAQRVKDRTAALEAANEELESFSYSVSHDLRAPVRAISGFSRLIAEHHAEELSVEVRRKLAIIENEAGRLSGLIDGLLSFSRSGRLSLKPQMLDMTALARAAFLRLGAEEPRARAVELSLAPLPQCSGDPTLVDQVWTNLLSNAVKFSSKRDRPRIEIEGTSDTERCTYTIRDNGAGFDPKYAAKLFDVFQRLHHDSEFPGSGVGLALVHRIVTRHGGRIWADAVLGEGATFHFELPAGTGTDGAGTV